ncbi:hypothetical protein [Ferruginibacter sp.]
MKRYLFSMLCAAFLWAGCSSSDDETTPPVATDGTISETALPKGKYVIEDDGPATKTATDPGGSLNGLDGNSNDNNAITPVISEVDNLKRRLKHAMVFHADDTMKIKKSYLATLVLGKDQVLSSLKTEALENSNAAPGGKVNIDTTLELGTKMKARLIDMSGAENKGFNIELIGGDEAATQSLTEKRKKVIWQWKLTPLVPGEQELKLSVTVLEKDGEMVNLPARNIPVIIFAEKEGFFSSIKSFFKDDSTKWIVTAIILPIFIAWLTTRIKYKHDSRRASEQQHAKDVAAAQGNAPAPAPPAARPPENTRGPHA